MRIVSGRLWSQDQCDARCHIVGLRTYNFPRNMKGTLVIFHLRRPKILQRLQVFSCLSFCETVERRLSETRNKILSHGSNELGFASLASLAPTHP